MAVEKIPCRECDTPAAEISGDKLVIVSKHHGGKHRNVFTLEWLIKKLEEAKPKRDNIAQN